MRLKPMRAVMTATCNGYVVSPEQLEAERLEDERQRHTADALEDAPEGGPPEEEGRTPC